MVMSWLVVETIPAVFADRAALPLREGTARVLFLYPSIKIILSSATQYWQTLIISAPKGSLPVFHGQGREHSEQFL